MDAASFKAAFESCIPEPTVERLIQRFNFALRQTDGEVFAAMAAVNELLAQPLTYEEFKARMQKSK